MRLAALTFITALLVQPSSAQTDLYLIAMMGQSNMSGVGELSELPVDFPKNPTKIWNFTNAYEWKPAREPIDSSEGQVDTVSRDRRARGVGPALALADAFVSRHPTTSVGLIPCAKGSTSISQWLKATGARPRHFVRLVHQSDKDSLACQRQPPSGRLLAGGKRCETTGGRTSVGERFTALPRDIREELGNPGCSEIFIMVMLGEKSVVNKRPYWQAVREQQHAVNIPGVIKIESDGFELRATS